MAHILPALRTARFAVRAFIAIALIAALLGSITSTAQAVAMGCRTDPIVVLDNGKVLRTTVEISVDAAQVTAIKYTLHLSLKEKVVQVIYTGGELKDKETLLVRYDGAPNTYRVETVVTTLSGATVTAFTAFRQWDDSDTRLSGDVLVTELKP